MATILDRILADKKKEVVARKALRSIDELMRADFFDRNTFSLKEALLDSKSGIISEFKRKSPSKGWIHADANVVEVTRGYCKSGACGISILTDEPYFGGTPADVLAARPALSCPVLRKDFVVDEYQLYEAKAMGADLVLLIAAALTVEQTTQFARKAHELGLEVLMEVHCEEELRSLNHYVDMVGVNNRNLKNFVTDVKTSFRLAKCVPDEFVKVSESGLSDVQTIKLLRAEGYRGFLMGETFMREPNPFEALDALLAEF